MFKWGKRATLLLFAFIIGIGLVACGGNNEESDGNAKGSGESDSSDELTGEVTMWTASLAGEPFDSYFDDLEKEFEDMHPELDVTIEDIPQNEIETKVLTSLTGDDVPDVVNLAPRYVTNIAAQQGLLDLEDLLSDEAKDSYIDGPFEAGQYDEGLFAVPWYLTTTSSWHNEDHFEEAGVTELPTSFSGVYETGKKVTEATGKPSYFQMINEGDKLINKIVSLANGESIVEDGKTNLKDNEKINEFFTLSQKMYQEGIMPQENAEGTFSTAQELFMAENLSFIDSGATFLGPIEEGAPDVYDAAKAGHPLRGEDEPVNVGVQQFSVPAKTDNPDAAVALAEFVTNAENQLEFSKVAGTVLPSTEESLDDDYFTDPGDSPKGQGRAEASKSVKRSEVLEPQLDNSPDLREIIKRAYIQNLQGDLTPEEAMDTIAEEWDASFEDEGIEPTF